MNEPKMVCIAKRGEAAISALILMNADGNLQLSAFKFTDETVASGMPKAFASLGLPPNARINVVVVVYEIPPTMLNAHVVAKFAAAVQANDTAYFYSLANSNGGQA